MMKKRALITHYIILILIGLFLLGIAVTNLYLSKEKQLESAFYPNVLIDNREVGGLTKDEVKQEYQNVNNALAKVMFNIVYNGQNVATLSAQQLNVRSNIDETADHAYLIGRTPQATSRVLQKITTIFHLRKYGFTTSITYDRGTVNETLSDLESQYNKPAKNALFQFEDNRVVTFRPDEKGLKLNTQQFISNFDKVVSNLDKNPHDINLTLTDTVVTPEITLAHANNFGIQELIATGKSDFTHSIPGRVHNVELAASKFNGVIIPKDSVFSFNDAVGDISANTGYQQAYIISNGKTVLGDGGGVCQVSTTLFRAAMNAGLPIVERTAHAYRVGYYENDAKPGFDATVFAPYVDLKIKNDTQAAILIQTQIDEENNLLYFNLYGKKDSRSVTITDPVLTNYAPAPPPKYEDDPTLPRGVTNQVDFAASGATSTFSYKVQNGNEITFQKTFVSVYKPWQAVFMVGTKD